MPFLATAPATDDLGEEVLAPYPPRRVISLSPSITSSLIEMGLGQVLIGRSRACGAIDRRAKRVPEVSVETLLDGPMLGRLRPELVFATPQELHPCLMESLRARCALFVFVADSVSASTSLIRRLGRVMGQPASAGRLSALCSSSLELLRGIGYGRIALVSWPRPLTLLGRDAHLESLVRWSGWTNVAAGEGVVRMREGRARSLSVDRVLVDQDLQGFDARRMKWLSALFGVTPELCSFSVLGLFAGGLIHRASDLGELLFMHRAPRG